MIRITINKWSEFQPRKDRKKHSWFRVDKDVMFSETLDKVSADQKWLWICLLAKACREDSGAFELDVDYFVKHSGVAKKKIIEALDLFAQKGAITLAEDLSGNRAVTSGDRAVSTGITTYERTNVQTNEQTFDFESIYQSYPRKRGKDEGIKRLRSRIKTQEQFEAFGRAVRKYAAETRRLRTDEKYIPYFSSFVGTDDKEPWRDFIEDPKPTVTLVDQHAANPEPAPEFTVEDKRRQLAEIEEQLKGPSIIRPLLEQRRAKLLQDLGKAGA